MLFKFTALQADSVPSDILNDNIQVTGDKCSQFAQCKTSQPPCQLCQQTLMCLSRGCMSCSELQPQPLLHVSATMFDLLL